MSQQQEETPVQTAVQVPVENIVDPTVVGEIETPAVEAVEAVEETEESAAAPVAAKKNDGPFKKISNWFKKTFDI